MGLTRVSLQQAIDGVLAAESELDDDRHDDAPDLEPGDDTAEVLACPAVEPESEPPLLAAAEAGASIAMAGSLLTVGRLDDVPLFFARGVDPRPQSFPIEPGFLAVLERTVRTVRARAPESFGRLERITSAGAFVNKPGFHGKGRAFDHDAWKFQHVNIRPIARDHVAPELAKRQRYWALAALMRSRSAFVLHGHFDAAHQDHIHQDNGGPRPFTTGSEATVKLVQAICNHIFGRLPELEIDGAFGPKSQAAATDAMHRVDLAGDITDPGQWKRFLLRSGRLGFELSMTHQP
ncbi:MAG TPA: hypothetical protein VNO82_07875 [Solirubrobacteraceae bacterium]|nr:hypothetical protein [Solirubrobacteraceae bacterium]